MRKVTLGFAIYKQVDYSRKCLDSILNSDLKGIDYEIVIANNACPEGSDILIEREYSDKFKNFKIIQNGSNKGCSGGWNAVIDNSDSEYIWIMNNDVVYHRNAIKNVLSFMDEEKGVFAVSPVILQKKHTTFDDPEEKVWSDIERAYQVFGDQAVPAWSIITGCARKELYGGLVGMYDENFTKAFYEDCDHGNRCIEVGIYGFTIGEAVAYHYGSKTTNTDNDLGKNKIYFESKYPNGPSKINSIEKLNKERVFFKEGNWVSAPIYDVERIENGTKKKTEIVTEGDMK